MTVHGIDVLRSRSEIRAARERLCAAGVSSLSPAPLRWLAGRRLWPWPVIGDWLKSWDVELTIERIRQSVPVDGSVVDMGAFGCEILPALSRAGYRKLVGVDLEPRLQRLRAPAGVHYQVGDFMAAEGADGTAAAVTAISVIEHGFDAERLTGALDRWLRPGGLFIASFDYWPDKIDTSQTRLFGLSWTIFSRAEIEAFLTIAERKGLRPDGPVRLQATDPVIHWEGRDYTFGWMALRKA